MWQNRAIRMSRVLIGALVVCVSASSLLTAAQPRTLTARSTFADILDEYQQGDPKRAVEVLSSWDEERLTLEAVVPEGAKGLVPPAAVALLLTEAGMASRRFGRIQNDSLQMSMGGWGLEKAFEVHSYRAYTLMEQLVDTAKANDDAELMAWVKSWYILTTSYCREFQSISVRCAEGLLEKGLHHADKNDPEVLLWRGAMAEPFIFSRWRLKNEFSDVGYGQESRHWFKKALEKQPMLVEARMRLGRSLHVTQNDPDAAEVLERALADALKVNHVFAAHLSALTLGEIHEDNGRLKQAIPYYRQAVDIYRGHTASVALGMALVRTGQRLEGWQQGTLMFGTKGPDNESLLDPWTIVRSAQYWQTASRIEEMRKAVRGEGR
jgi:tetratricopeptide (TPR) repeat protein